ncbi:MAG: hypothetical protein K6G88_11135 [Lachnospiraceae bacterium]|nr:hypothetical protein [Lachnospiraceae bacterium]
MTREDAIKDIKEHVKLDGNGRIVLVGEISPITIDMAINALGEQKHELQYRVGKEIKPSRCCTCDSEDCADCNDDFNRCPTL